MSAAGQGHVESQTLSKSTFQVQYVESGGRKSSLNHATAEQIVNTDSSTSRRLIVILKLIAAPCTSVREYRTQDSHQHSPRQRPYTSSYRKFPTRRNRPSGCDSDPGPSTIASFARAGRGALNAVPTLAR